MTARWIHLAEERNEADCLLEQADKGVGIHFSMRSMIYLNINALLSDKLAAIHDLLRFIPRQCEPTLTRHSSCTSCISLTFLDKIGGKLGY